MNLTFIYELPFTWKTLVVIHSQNSPDSFIAYLQRSRNKQSVCISELFLGPRSTYFLMSCNSILVHISEILLWFGAGITSVQRLIQRHASSSWSSQCSRTIFRSAIEKRMELELHLNKVIQRIKSMVYFPSLQNLHI